MGNLNGQHLKAKWLNFVLQDITMSYQLGQKVALVAPLHPPSLIHRLHTPFLFFLKRSLYHHHHLLVLRLPPHQPFLFSSQL